MAIAGIVTVSIFQIFGGVMLNWKKAESRMNNSFHQTNLFILLSKKLDELYQYKAIKDYEKYFNGKSHEILFISFYSVKIPYFPVTTRIFLDSEGKLTMEETPFFFDRKDADIPEPVSTVLWDGVEDFTVWYLVDDRMKRGNLVWREEYVKEGPRSDTLAAIKMEIKFKDGNEMTVFSYLKQEGQSGATGGLI